MFNTERTLKMLKAGAIFKYHKTWWLKLLSRNTDAHGMHVSTCVKLSTGEVFKISDSERVQEAKVLVLLKRRGEDECSCSK